MQYITICYNQTLEKNVVFLFFQIAVYRLLQIMEPLYCQMLELQPMARLPLTRVMLDMSSMV